MPFPPLHSFTPNIFEQLPTTTDLVNIEINTTPFNALPGNLNAIASSCAAGFGPVEIDLI
jgi:hypothetical protein